MTLLSALDPSLLIYKFSDWQQRRDHCFARFESLNFHMGMIHKYFQKIGMSQDFMAAVIESFPWCENYGSFAELRDLRLIILQDLQKAEFCDDSLNSHGRIEPRGIVCQHVECQVTMEYWISMLCCFLSRREYPLQIATWNNASLHGHSGPILLYCDGIPEPGQSHSYSLPLVWDEETWFAELEKLDLWDIDNLHLCIEVHFRANPSYNHMSGVLAKPTPFKLSATFKRELAKHSATDKALQRAFIEALTRLVHRIPDPSLGVEVIQSRRRANERRFRITCSGHPPLRVHYHVVDGTIILDRFGPHRIDGID